MAGVQEVAINIDDKLETSADTNHGKTKLNGENIDDQSVENLLTLVKKGLDEVPGKPFEPRTVTIFRLPTWFHQNDLQDLCEPKIVAIGPYHHGKECLRTMEEHKWFTLRDFLARNKDVGLEVYLQSMKSVEVQARLCYSETLMLKNDNTSETEKLESDEFAKMLLLDGCFILELLLKCDSDQKDDICEVGWAADFIFRDLCMLENQIPLFVIHKLLEIQLGRSQNCEEYCPLLDYVSKFFERFPYINTYKKPQKSCGGIHHLLHLYYMGVVPEFIPVGPMVNQMVGSRASIKTVRRHTNIACASELFDAGVKFKKKETPCMLDIKFNKNGTIEMPVLKIQITDTRILWNMVAFEQSGRPWGFQQVFSSYLALMDSLINTKKDVAILERSGIVENYFQNSAEAAFFFNQFVNNFRLDHDKHYFHGLFQDVKEYSESTWHKYRARLMQDYFSNPWSIISVFAAGIAFLLSILQTYYSAKK